MKVIAIAPVLWTYARRGGGLHRSKSVGAVALSIVEAMREA